MSSKVYLSLAVVASVCLLSGHVQASDSLSALEQRICDNLKTTSTQILDDTSDTSKYLSPYIAAEIYDRVVAKSLEAGDVSDGLQAPRMAQLPCVDTVSTYLMSIKKRMEFNRVDYFLARYRFWIFFAMIVALLGVWFYWRLDRHATNVAEQ
jgi:hypothetical protein